VKNITIRGIDPELEKSLRSSARENADSMNTTILKLLRKALGLDKPMPFPEYHDLDDLAGTWSKEDEEEFNRVQKELSEIDEELWK
jgi:hypothetical protein